jgi:hypothetical protein
VANEDIGKLIVDELVTQITAVCQTPYATSEDTRVNLVVRGEFQDDPEDFGVIVCVHRNDPDRVERIGTSSWQDERDITEMGAVIGTGGVGHVEHWFRRFTVECIVWPNEEQEAADRINGIVMARVRRAVTMESMHGLVDTFGEAITVGSSPVVKMKVNEGGGPDDEYSWRGFLYLQYKTVWTP